MFPATSIIWMLFLQSILIIVSIFCLQSFFILGELNLFIGINHVVSKSPYFGFFVPLISYMKFSPLTNSFKSSWICLIRIKQKISEFYVCFFPVHFCCKSDGYKFVKAGQQMLVADLANVLWIDHDLDKRRQELTRFLTWHLLLH